MAENEEFRRLRAEHQEHERELEALKAVPSLSADQHWRISELKKLKLMAKDRMEAIDRARPATASAPDGPRLIVAMPRSRPDESFRGLTHLTPEGAARMVDVSAKPETSREAVARAVLRMTPGDAARHPRGQRPQGRRAGRRAHRRHPRRQAHVGSHPPVPSAAHHRRGHRVQRDADAASWPSRPACARWTRPASRWRPSPRRAWPR